jgi:hypothetical protein
MGIGFSILNSGCLGGRPKGILSKAEKAQRDIETAVLSVEINAGGVKKSNKMEIDYKNQKAHIVSSVSGRSKDSYVVGNTAYNKVFFHWTKSPAEEFWEEQKEFIPLNVVIKAEKVGEESVKDVVCHVLDVTIPKESIYTLAGEVQDKEYLPEQLKAKCWISKDTNQVRRFYIFTTYTVNGQKDTISIDYIVEKINVPLQIELPDAAKRARAA